MSSHLRLGLPKGLFPVGLNCNYEGNRRLYLKRTFSLHLLCAGNATATDAMQADWLRSSVGAGRPRGHCSDLLEVTCLASSQGCPNQFLQLNNYSLPSRATKSPKPVFTLSLVIYVSENVCHYPEVIISKELGHSVDMFWAHLEVSEESSWSSYPLGLYDVFSFVILAFSIHVT